MNLKSLKYSLIVPAILSATLFGCLKDEGYDNRDYQAGESHNDGKQNVISVALTATTTDNHLQLAFEKSDVDTTFDAIPITLGGEPAEQDIQVRLALNPALLGSYNAANGTTHEEVPLDLITILNSGSADSGYIVTIPRGSNTGYLRITIKPNDYLGFDYALGVQISSVSAGYLIAKNISTGILAIGVKNEWDGVYSYKGYSLRAGDPDLTGNFSDQEMTLITAGATSLRFQTLALWGDGNSGISIGNVILSLNTNVNPPYPVTITSTDPSVGTTNAPGYNSRYEPDSKTFYISFTWGAGPAARLSTDTLTFLRSR
jgi:hypothetical protein